MTDFSRIAARRLASIAAAASLSVVGFAPIAGCDVSSDTAQVNTSKTAGVVSFGVDEGIDMVSGSVQESGNFGNSDLYATQNGSALKLSPGGSSIVKTRLVTWFQTSGGVFPTYENIDQVPNVKPTDGSLPLPKAATGNGFVLENSAGTFTKGYVVSATATTITIQYEPLP